MYILAVDSSAVQASVCISDGEKTLGEFYIDTRQKHSRTLMTMVENTLQCVGLALSDIGLFAVTAGPGSFTGVRIGVSCVKGMALPFGTPCVGVSALEALAFSCMGSFGAVCPVMDARCGQVYTALFRWKDGIITRETDDETLPLEILAARLSLLKEPVSLCGDAAYLCANDPAFAVVPHRVLRFAAANRASFVSLAANEAYIKGQAVSPEALTPVYLSLPQAQREQMKKMEEKS